MDNNLIFKTKTTNEKFAEITNQIISIEESCQKLFGEFSAKKTSSEN